MREAAIVCRCSEVGFEIASRDLERRAKRGLETLSPICVLTYVVTDPPCSPFSSRKRRVSFEVGVGIDERDSIFDSGKASSTIGIPSIGSLRP